MLQMRVELLTLLLLYLRTVIVVVHVKVDGRAHPWRQKAGCCALPTTPLILGTCVCCGACSSCIPVGYVARTHGQLCSSQESRGVYR